MNADTLNRDWRDFAPTIKRSIIACDHDFYDAAVDKFTVSIVADESNKWEKPFETVLEAEFAEQEVEDVLDLLGFFFHVASHQRCDLFWEKCPVPMNTFTPHELDLIEEIYNQRLVKTVAPEWHSAFPLINMRYDEYKGFDVAKRQPLQTMFGPRCDTGIAELNTLHAWLYDSYPLSQQTFNTYMHMWTVLLGVPKIKEAIVDYES